MNPTFESCMLEALLSSSSLEVMAAKGNEICAAFMRERESLWSRLIAYSAVYVTKILVGASYKYLLQTAIDVDAVGLLSILVAKPSPQCTCNSMDCPEDPSVLDKPLCSERQQEKRQREEIMKLMCGIVEAARIWNRNDVLECMADAGYDFDFDK